jgi:dsRNA-specific ribonuclease
LEKSHTLSEISHRIDLPKYAIIARNMEITNARYCNEHLAEDLFESFIGALSLEISFSKCKKFIINIIESELDIANMIYKDENYKDQLMKQYQKLKWAVPKYNDEEADLINKHFVISVKDPDGHILGVGTSNTKSKASQIAAQNALIKLGIIKEEKQNDEIYGELDDL